MIYKTKWIIFEWVIIWIIALRVSSFFHNSLEQSIYDSVSTIQSMVTEKERSCEKLTKIVVNLQLHDVALGNEVNGEISDDIHTCFIELSQLRNFASHMNKWNIVSFSVSMNKYIAEIAKEILRKAANPASAYRCFRDGLCFDARGAFDLPILPSITSSLDFMVNHDNYHTIHLSAVIIVLAYAIGIQVLRYMEAPVRSSSLIVFVFHFGIIVSDKFRVLRVGFMIFGYVSAFLVIPPNTGSSLLMRAFVQLSCHDTRNQIRFAIAAYMISVTYYIGYSSFQPQLIEKRRCLELERIDRLVASQWMEQPWKLNILSDITLLEILKLVDLADLRADQRSLLLEVVLSKPVLMYLYSNRGAYSENSVSQSGQRSRDLCRILVELGHSGMNRKYPPFLSALSLIIMLTVSSCMKRVNTLRTQKT